jgi:hypothetical protein
MQTVDTRSWLYCAGKIAPCDWRNELFGTRGMDAWGAFDCPPQWSCWDGRPPARGDDRPWCRSLRGSCP